MRTIIGDFFKYFDGRVCLAVHLDDENSNYRVWQEPVLDLMTEPVMGTVPQSNYKP